MPRHESTSHALNECWRISTLDTNEGSQAAFRFEHPKREAEFPNIYLLPEPHPLRPEYFTLAHHPSCTRPAFKDYVLTIRKTSDFMESWKKVGAETATPADNVVWNERNGACPLPSVEVLSDTCMHAGWLQLEEGDMVWVRDLGGTKKPEDDVIRFYYISS